MLNFGGYSDAVYRLTLGEVPYLVGTFSSGLQRGTEADIELVRRSDIRVGMPGPCTPPIKMVVEPAK